MSCTTNQGQLSKLPLVLQYNFELQFYYLTKMTPSIVYSVGTLVEVDHTKTGYIIELDDTDNNNVVLKVNYTIGNKIESHVHQSRCRPISLRRALTTRSGAIRQAIPLLLVMEMEVGEDMDEDEAVRE